VATLTIHVTGRVLLHFLGMLAGEVGIAAAGAKSDRVPAGKDDEIGLAHFCDYDDVVISERLVDFS
jgi:hypothetical protein